MATLLEQLTAQVDKHAAELDRRSRTFKRLEPYYEGSAPFPVAVTESRLTQAYRRMMPVADAPWGSLVVDSVLDRLEIGGVQDDNKDAADAVWDIWQRNHMDSESKLAHNAGLISGRAFALVWPSQDDDGDIAAGMPEISLDNSDQMIVRYQEGSRHKRVSALRRWVDDDSGATMATLYRPDGIYKFQEDARPEMGQRGWVRRLVDGEDWPVENPWGVVPVVELAFNPRLKAGVWGHARGEYEHCLGLIDRINLLTFLGLVVAFWMGFPLRAVIGDRILRDDDGNVIPPFKVGADGVVQLENPQARLDSYPAADRSNLSVYPELAQLAAITKTPRHYFPLAQAMANLSADAIRADEGALTAKVTGHKGFVGEGWGEVHRLCGLMADKPLSPSAQVVWLDHESRSLAERADAATKLASILPWQVVAERVLNATQDDLTRWAALKADDVFSKLLTAASTPVPASQNGNGNLVPDLTPAPPAG